MSMTRSAARNGSGATRYSSAPAAAGPPGRRVVVVSDVRRATGSLVAARVDGGRDGGRVADGDGAVRRVDRIGRDSVPLGGERGGEPVPGFHLGNTPLEFTRE